MLEKMDVEAYKQFGFYDYGPFVENFCNWIDALCKKECVHKLFFCSRDAFFFNIAFSKLFDGQYDHEYLYVSKKSLALAMFGTEIDEDHLLTYIFANRGMFIEDILLQIGFQDEEVLRAINELEIKPRTFLDREKREDRNKVIKIIRYVKLNYKSKIEEQVNLCREYFSKIGFRGRIGLVDVGWRGSIQMGLEIIMEYLKIPIEIIGLYVGICPKAGIHIKKYHGFLYEGFQKGKKYYQLMSGVALIEMFGMAQHGTVVRYAMDIYGNVKPLYNSYEYFSEDNYSREYWIIKAIQSGALKYIEGTNKENSGHLLNKISCPDKEVFNAFKGCRCSNCELRPIIYISNLKEDKNHFIKKMIQEFKLSYWKSGYIYKYIKNGKLAFAIYVIAKKIFG